MSSVTDNLRDIAASLPAGVTLVAVSKTKPAELIAEAYGAGQRVFGENKVQEMAEKHAELPGDIEWHMIGHVQTNKVRLMAPFVSLVHGVDSLKVLETIDKEAARAGRVIPCLLQFHIAREETKFGLTLEEARELLESESYRGMRHARVAGVMGMATNTDDEEQVRREFRGLRATFETLRGEYFAGDAGFREVSMGMSGDYRIAVEEGSTMVRVGSAIFGARQYKV